MIAQPTIRHKASGRRRLRPPRPTRTRHVLHLCAETFPLQYAFIERVFNELLPEVGYHPTWIMPSDEVEASTCVDWNGNELCLLHKIRPTTVTSLFTDYVKHYRRVRCAARQAVSKMKHLDLVQVRDDPVMAKIGFAIAKDRRIPFVYQLSHLKEEEVLLLSRGDSIGRRAINLLKD